MDSTTLQIASDLSLPVDYVTKTVGILAQRRKGKTYTANVIAEEFVAAGLPFVALDPTGAWWGLRASADGQTSGLPVTILGGEHGDVPINRTDGKGVAELVVDEPGWYVIDFSLFESNAAEVQFAADFAQRLYRRKGQPNSDFPMHLFVDEADRFVPQRPAREKGEGSETTMLGAFEAIVRRGGLRGLGTTLISQRSAVVNKNVLEQVDVLMVLRTVGPNDRARIIDIVSAEGTKEQIDEVKASMASLELGEAWFWEPGEGIFQRIHVRERTTFNSSATPKPGEKRVEPRRLASVDLEAIKERWEATLEKAKADDPKELRKQIAVLQRELAERPVPDPVVERVEVPVVPAVLIDLLTEQAAALLAMSESTSGAIVQALDSGPVVAANTVSPRHQPRPVPPKPVSRPVSVPVQRSSEPVGDVRLGAGERKILAAVAQYANGVTREQLTVLTGYKRSSRDTYLQRLRQAGCVVLVGSAIMATDTGIETLGDDYEPLPTGSALRDHWLRTLPEGERALLSLLIEAWPDGVPRDDLSDRTGYKRSSRDTYLQRLRSRQLIDTSRGDPRAVDGLFTD